MAGYLRALPGSQRVHARNRMHQRLQPYVSSTHSPSPALRATATPTVRGSKRCA